MTLSPVSLAGNFFSRANRRFVPIGAHWVPAKTGLQWPLQWDEADLEADFAKMQDLGFNTLRFDLFWAWFEPRPGDYNPEAFRQFDAFIRLAHQYEIYLHPTLFIGGEVGEAFWDLPWRQGRHPHADPEMLRLQTDHAAFESPEPTHQIYRGLRQWGGLAPSFSTDVSGIEVAGLTGERRGYAVLANHQPEKRSITVTSRTAVKTVQQIDPAGKHLIAWQDNQWQLELPAYGGAVFEWVTAGALKE